MIISKHKFIKAFNCLYLLTPLFLFCLIGYGCNSDHVNSDRNITEPSLSKMVGQMIMLGFRGLEISEDSPIVEAIEEVKVGGVVLYDQDVILKEDTRNVDSPDQLRCLVQELQARSETPLLVAIDQEGGQISRLKTKYGFPPTMSAAKLGKIDQTDRTEVAARRIGQTLNRVKVNLDLAPVVDVNVNPQNPAIGRLDRSFSKDPEEVIEHATAFIRGLHAEGILSCIKHFPGHGSAWNDSHFGLTDITQTWTKQELRPFQAIIEKGLCDAVMTGHLFNAKIDSEYPATLSVKALKGLLRDKLGFKGVIISDDMQMAAIKEFYGLREAVYRFIKAGGDILLFANNLQYDPKIAIKVHGLILDMVSQGRIETSRIRDSYCRIMHLKRRLGQDPVEIK